MFIIYSSPLSFSNLQGLSKNLKVFSQQGIQLFRKTLYVSEKVFTCSAKHWKSLVIPVV